MAAQGAVAADPFADPFAAPPPGVAAGGGGDRGPRRWRRHPPTPRANLDQAFQVVREEEYGAAGLPGQKPAWFLPVLVGVVALVVGGVVTLAVMLR